MSNMNRREFLADVARLGLLTGVAADATRLRAGEAARTIRGRVLGGDRPLVGVLVSDGRRVGRTDSDGEYELSTGPESGRFVFVTTPRGFWTERFYVPIGAAARTGRADFRLHAVDQPDRFDFAFVADMHLERRVGIPKFRASLEEINRLEPAPAFLWAQGDICLQGGMGKEYVACLAVAEMPVRNGAGNHEMILKRPNPRDDFERLFGPTYYSFDWGPVHCIVLDGNKPIPEEEGWKAVHGAVEGSELAWLEADLAAQPPGKPIIVGVHIPIVSSYPERRQHSPKNAPYWEVTNDQVLTDLLARHHVRLVLQGHMHENERQTVDGVEYVASISISGSWWKAGEGFERGVDGSPRGYRIVSVDGTRVTHRYRSSGESHVDRRGEFYGLEDSIRPGPETAFVFNGYDAPNGSTAKARIDDGPWQPMPPHAARSATTPDLTMPHHFRLVADTTALATGEHTVEARVRWPDGTVVTERDRFLLRNG
jgi:hypothetical protein